MRGPPRAFSSWSSATKPEVDRRTIEEGPMGKNKYTPTKTIYLTHPFPSPQIGSSCSYALQKWLNKTSHAVFLRENSPVLKLDDFMSHKTRRRRRVFYTQDFPHHLTLLSNFPQVCFGGIGMTHLAFLLPFSMADPNFPHHFPPVLRRQNGLCSLTLQKCTGPNSELWILLLLSFSRNLWIPLQ